MNENSYQQITQEAAKEMMDTREVVILDVRELHEFLFKDLEYSVSQTVQSYSDEIEYTTGLGQAARQEAIENSIVPDTGSEADLVR